MMSEFGRRGYDYPQWYIATTELIQERLVNLAKCQENTVTEVKELRNDITDIKKQINEIHVKQAKLPVMVEGAKLMLYAIAILILLLLLIGGKINMEDLIFKAL